jgi:hypothetical protein
LVAVAATSIARRACERLVAEDGAGGNSGDGGDSGDDGDDGDTLAVSGTCRDNGRIFDVTVGIAIVVRVVLKLIAGEVVELVVKEVSVGGGKEG